MELQSRKLIEIGVDVNSVIRRLGGNELLYLSICNKFVKDKNFQCFQEAISIQDYQTAELRIHTLKGVCANLGFIQLEDISKTLLHNLKDNDLSSIPTNNQRLTVEYHRIISILKEFTA